MIAYTKGKILISEEQPPFQNEQGEQVFYTKNYVKFIDEDGFESPLTELNSKTLYKDVEQKEVILKLNIQPQFGGKGFKVTIAGAKVDEVNDIENIEF